MSSKSKKIIKSEKSIRTRSKCSYQYQPTYLSLFKTSKSLKKQKNTPMMRTCIDQIQVCEDFPPSSEKIIISLNLGKYGFDSQCRNNLKTIEEILSFCDFFVKNPITHEVEWKHLSQKILQKFGDKFCLIQGNKAYFVYSQKLQNYIEITRQQINLLRCLRNLTFNVRQSCMLPILLEKINNYSQKIRMRINSSKKFLELKAENKKIGISNKNSLLMTEVAFKTFVQGLSELKIDELNYFLLKQYEQNNRSSRNQKRLNNWQDWISFIQKKRVRLRKANKFLLHTSCQFCLSPYSESNNPIENCSQCHIRGHRLCLGEGKNSRCGRCIYLRLPNETKSKVPECFMCNTINLSPLKISSVKFAHIFCLFSHNMWEVKNGRIEFREADQNQLQNRKSEKCKICHKDTYYYTKCLCCGSFYHYSCGYLNGFCFKLDEENRINLSCCSNSKYLMQELSQKRKYILNYNNIVFKRLASLQKQIRKGKKRGRKPKINSKKRHQNQTDQKKMDEENFQHYLDREQKRQSQIPEVESEQLYEQNQIKSE